MKCPLEISPEEKRRLIGVWIALLATIAFAYVMQRPIKSDFIETAWSLTPEKIRILFPLSIIICIGVVLFGNFSAIWVAFTMFGLLCFQLFDFGLSYKQEIFLSLLWIGIGIVMFSLAMGVGGGSGGGTATLDDIKDLLEEIKKNKE